MKNLAELDLKNKRVVIREDFNVPLTQGKVVSDARLRAALPTIRMALDKGAAVILLSHLGRPQEGQLDPALSLQPIAEALTHLLGRTVRFEKNYLQGITITPGEVVLCENVRFNLGEKANDTLLAAQLAALGDVYVMDAFATAHRAEASTEGVLHQAKVAVAGPLLAAEVEAISRVLAHPKRPLLAIVGGSKVSTKLALLEHIADKADQLIVGGGILNTFLLAAGYSIGKSLVELALVPTAKRILEKITARGANLPLPVDVVVAPVCSLDAKARIVLVNQVQPEEMILDIGPKTCADWKPFIQKAGTILWNGPVGVFELPAFAEGTKALANAIAASQAFSVAGGGDTLAAIEQFGVSSKLSYLSTGGGAFLECLEGKILPAVAALSKEAIS